MDDTRNGPTFYQRYHEICGHVIATLYAGTELNKAYGNTVFQQQHYLSAYCIENILGVAPIRMQTLKSQLLAIGSILSAHSIKRTDTNGTWRLLATSEYSPRHLYYSLTIFSE